MRIRRRPTTVLVAAAAVITGLGLAPGAGLAQPPAGEVLWSSTFDDFDDFRDGDSGIRQIDPPDTTAEIVEDPADPANSVGVFTINSGERAEFMPDFRDLVEGDDLWFGLSTRLDGGYPTDEAWQVVAQWKNDGNGSPPLSLVAEDGEYKLHGGFGHPAGDRSFTESLGGSGVDTWDRWVFHVEFNSDPSAGSIDAWRNGEQVLAGFQPPGGTLYPGLDSYLKVGYYRNSDISAPGSVFYDDYRVGTSMAAVQ